MQALPLYDDALATLLSHAPTLSDERVALDVANGRVLVEPIVTDRDQPAFNRSAMDGFAVRSREIGTRSAWAIVGHVAAGSDPHRDESVARSGVVRIGTGAALPDAYDAVIPIEQAQVEESGDTSTVRFTIDSVEPGRNIHRRGSDAKSGDTVVAMGTRLSPATIGIAATAGKVELKVKQRPRIAILTSGDEVRDPSIRTTDLPAHHIRNSNGPMLRALFEALGAAVVYQEHIPDEPEATRAAARDALSRAHVVVTVGGASVGERDYLRWAWSKLGYRVALHGARIQPGKPVYAAVAGAVNDGRALTSHASQSAPTLQKHGDDTDDVSDNKLVLGLPGNPVSVLATAHLFALPLLRHMVGLPARPTWRTVRLTNAAQPKSARQLFRAARLEGTDAARIVTWHGSGDLMHLAAADGFVALPMQDEPVPAGTALPFLPIVR